MGESSRRRHPRRAFLKQLPAAVVTGLGAPLLDATGSASQPSTPAEAIAPNTLAAAQQVAGLDMPLAEIELAQVLVERNRTNIRQLRAVAIPDDTEPAFSYRPRVPPPSREPMLPAPTAHPRVRSSAVRPLRGEDLAFAPVTRLSALLRDRRITSVELTRMYLDRLRRHDITLHCTITTTETLALEQATLADREIAEGRYRGPLHGIPYGIKDLFATRGIRTTWGAQPYVSQVPDRDATAVTRMREAGAVLVAKLATGELAIGDLWFGARTRNPWDPDRGSSGSSAGPASAVAAGLVGFAVGTETGGSIVSPAATCGVVGLRPTYGRIPRTGCMTLRWTLDKVGPLARTVADAALVLEALAGPDGRDETVVDRPFTWDGERRVEGLRIGVVTRELEEPPPRATAEELRGWRLRKTAHEAALEVLRNAGATMTPVRLPDLPAAAVYAMLNAEAGAMFDELLRTGGINALADKGLNGRANQLRAARFIPAVEYIRAQRIRTMLAQEMERFFESIDVFVTSSASDSVTITNLTGHPAVVVPAGFVDALPTGLMVTGGLWREDQVLRVASAFEAATTWHEQHPPKYAD